MSPLCSCSKVMKMLTWMQQVLTIVSRIKGLRTQLVVNEGEVVHADTHNRHQD